MYSSVFDVRNALTPGADTADKSTAAGLTDAQIEDAIAEADAVINAYCSDGYIVPLMDVTISEDPLVVASLAVQPLRFWSRDLAAYLATLTFKRNKDVPENDPVRLRYTMIMEMLRMVRAGKMNLPLDATPDTGPGTVSTHNLYTGNLFGAEDFELTTRSGYYHGW